MRADPRITAALAKRVEAEIAATCRYSHPTDRAGYLSIEKDAAAKVLAERRREIGAQLTALKPRLTARKAAALTEAAELIAEREGVTLIWRHADTFPPGARAYAHPISRKAHVPILVDGDLRGFAIVCHEIGHCIAEPHRGVDHAADPDQEQWRHCLGCESAAWEKALTIAPTPLLRAVHAAAVESLAIYTSMTPGTRAAFRRVERVRGNVSLAEERFRRLAEEN